MTTNSSIYIFVPKSKITWPMVNLSTADGKMENLVTYKDSYIIETDRGDHDVFLPFPHYKAEEVVKIVNGTETSWWDWFTGLFGN